MKQLLLRVSFCNCLQTSDIAILHFLGFNIIWNVWPSVTLRLDRFRHDLQMPLLQELAFLVAFSEETFTSVSVCETVRRFCNLQGPFTGITGQKGPRLAHTYFQHGVSCYCCMMSLANTRRGEHTAKQRNNLFNHKVHLHKAMAA